ncbi:putative exosome complex component rrp40 isoform X1 [Papaver somniferum]|uniref:putative exosome complex component rrp40 isoform X1 n=1 Tax=Papaver somniferum TaxID=3469 RepID=UPI000E6F7A64|nr:putative exosome complex component rrp40 isoform X1 [Papaver somniferum]XP_026423962.1 putative exosome complex component rrp40 isoform X1 [Papaver somniferum]
MVEEKKHSDSQSTMVKKIVVPGDVVLDLLKLSNQTIKLGDGLRQYVPCVENTVLGIVLDSKADNFLVDIKGPAVAFLPVLAFEGGTRRNIPKFEPASLIYVRVVKANMGMNPELSCTDGILSLVDSPLMFELVAFCFMLYEYQFGNSIFYSNFCQ